MTDQIANDIATLRPLLLTAMGEMVGVITGRQGYYTPQDRVHEYLHLYALRVGPGHDRDLDTVIRLYNEWDGDLESRSDLEALREGVEAAIETAEILKAQGVVR